MPDGGTFPDGSTLRGSLDLARYEWPARHYTAYFREPYPVAERLWLGSIVTGQKDASGLLYRRNRYFDPQANQFTQEDPIGIAGGLNTYGFAGGDPVSYSDPYGLCPPCAAGAVAAETSPTWGPVVVTGAKVLVGAIAGWFVGRRLPLSTTLTGESQFPVAQRDGASWASDFIVTPGGTAVPVSQQRMKDGFDRAGVPSRPTISPGTEYILPDGRRVRAMDPSGPAPRRASFENAHGHPVTPDGTVPQPPRGATRQQRKQYVRERTHVEQTQ